jgi:hypothetical protein
MSSWRKVKNLFWQTPDGSAGQDPSEATEISDAELAQLISGSPNAVPPGQLEPIETGTVPFEYQAGAVKIDFQAQYDLAGIPDTDEVEQLENFLSRLDASLPNASKLAAAQAFLGAIGKAKEDVLGDAVRKIQRVRGILAAQEEATRAGLTGEQQQIDELQRQIEQHRQRMEILNGELEGVRQACVTEESRLQAARLFFGSFDSPRG